MLEHAGRTAHLIGMHEYLAAALLGLGLIGGALAAEPEIRETRPYLLPPPPATERLSPVERGRAELQRDILRGAERSLDRRHDLGKLDGFGQRDRLELRGETQRFERLLQQDRLRPPPD
ncbi:MAG TPA: hypothetical protein VK943_10610 [Arenibaculum sp.]|nr:hypothetical protein [Arenibaculum sp.]